MRTLMITGAITYNLLMVIRNLVNYFIPSQDIRRNYQDNIDFFSFILKLVHNIT